LVVLPEEIWLVMKLGGRYILDADLREVACEDLLKWAMWMESADRHVGAELIEPYWVSTVFLGLDHNYFPSGRPLLYETMIFKYLNYDNLKVVQLVDRYHTWTEAEQGHILTVKQVKAGLLPNHNL
jgi:hypothetical protein